MSEQFKLTISNWAKRSTNFLSLHHLNPHIKESRDPFQKVFKIFLGALPTAGICRFYGWPVVRNPLLNHFSTDNYPLNLSGGQPVYSLTKGKSIQPEMQLWVHSYSATCKLFFKYGFNLHKIQVLYSWCAGVTVVLSLKASSTVLTRLCLHPSYPH